MAELCEQPFDLPVFVENDAAAAAMGEMQLGLGQTLSSFFYILISSGLGSGIVVDGAYFRGADGRSGELGFLRAPTEDGGIQQVQKLVSLSGLAKHLAADGLTLADALAAERPARAEKRVAPWEPEDRRVGKEGVSTCRSRWAAAH